MQEASRIGATIVFVSKKAWEAATPEGFIEMKPLETYPEMKASEELLWKAKSGLMAVPYQ